jgi:hypothetical protein
MQASPAVLTIIGFALFFTPVGGLAAAYIVDRDYGVCSLINTCQAPGTWGGLGIAIAAMVGGPILSGLVTGAIVGSVLRTHTWPTLIVWVQAVVSSAAVIAGLVSAEWPVIGWAALGLLVTSGMYLWNVRQMATIRSAAQREADTWPPREN